MLERRQAEQVVEWVRGASHADEVHLWLEDREARHQRFARNSPSTSGWYTDRKLTVQSTFGTRSAASTVNQIDEGAIGEVVRRSEELAKLAPEDPEFVPGLGPQVYPEVAAFFPEDGIEAAARMVKGIAASIEQAAQRGVVAAGFGRADTRNRCIANGRGLFGFHRETEAHFSQTVRTQDGSGSGWASQIGNRVADLDFASNTATAIDKAQKSAKPQALPPGKYTTVLEPACVASLARILVDNMDARSADEGRSFFSSKGGRNRIGEQLFPESLSIYSDPNNPVAPSTPWDSEGLPQRRLSWIDKGIVANLPCGRYWAKKQGREPVPTRSNIIVRGGQGNVEDLVASVDKGVLITSLWYIRRVDPQTMLYTGLTRDGVFWIENGRIAHPVTNFRWNDSPVRVFKKARALSRTGRISPRSRRDDGIAVPGLVVDEFELTSVSDAI